MKKQLQFILASSLFLLSFTSSAIIQVVTPNGGEVWTVGTTQKITWTGGSGNGTATITYSYDGGANWNMVGTAAASAGSYNWLIPNTPSSKCLVLVGESSTNFDQSNAMFTIFASSTGMKNLADVSGNSVVVYPNPAIDNLNISLAGGQQLQYVKIYNMLGSLVKEVVFGDAVLSTVTISVSDLAKGTYFAEIKTDDATFTEKVSVVK